MGMEFVVFIFVFWYRDGVSSGLGRVGLGECVVCCVCGSMFFE